MKKRSIFRAFTIIELLVVIVIIGLLTAAAVANYSTAQKRARDNARKTTVQNIANAVEAYYAVNKKFPGKMSTTIDGNSSIPSRYIGCEQKDLKGNYYYYYTPLTTTCDLLSPDSNGKYTYTPSDYLPAPLWIPGIGPYLTPIPIEKQYSDATGGTTTKWADVLGASDTSASDRMRTYMYRHLNGGYAIYTRLEFGSSVEADLYDGSSSAVYFTDQPNLPSCNGTRAKCLTVTGTNIYFIRK